MSSVLPTALALDPARDIVFGPKDGKHGKYASTSLEAGGDVKFCIGSVAKPLRAPFGISEPFAGDANTSRRTMDLELKDPRVEMLGEQIPPGEQDGTFLEDAESGALRGPAMRLIFIMHNYFVCEKGIKAL
jgi:hypothetical protein